MKIEFTGACRPNFIKTMESSARDTMVVIVALVVVVVVLVVTKLRSVRLNETRRMV